jgi:uncharacterized membrane protein YidH (DUF202 family)
MSSATAALIAGVFLVALGGIVLANAGARRRAARVNATRAQIGRPTTSRGVAALCVVFVVVGLVLVIGALVS